MKNDTFMNKSDLDKRKDLIKILDKRCNNMIRLNVLNSIVERLNLNKQMSIEVVNSGEIEDNLTTETIYKIENDDIVSIDLKWCRCLLGCIEFGCTVKEVTDGSVVVKDRSKSKIISKPLFILREEQTLGDLDSNKCGLYICL